MIVGFETADDAGVFRLSDSVALVQTVDFFTPVADEPKMYGRAAAVNSLNDIYAMGGTPISALSIVCYPQKGDWEVLASILAGGQAAMNEEGVVVIGGHSVDDQEMKFGYAVTGTIHPNRIVTNASAKPGDVLILTKAIGTGAINTAIKYGKASAESENAAIKSMTTSAAEASRSMVRHGASACTDVTGFGLLGHAYEMAKASNVTIMIESNNVPLLPDVLKLIREGMLTRGDKYNRTYVGDTVSIATDVSAEIQSALFDPQTAGGLLISIEETGAEDFLKEISDAVVIGRVGQKKGSLIEVR